MHKKKSKQSVLAGEMILTFFKTGAPKSVQKTNNFDVSETLGHILAATNSGKIYGEYLFNKVVIEAWNRSAIGSLNISKTEFIDLIKQHGWRYDEEHHYWVKGQPAAASLFS
jgi:hypothetical protein